MIGPSDALKRWLTQAPPDEAWIDVLELTHPAWPQGYVLTNWRDPIEVTFETGRKVTPLNIAFAVDPPDAGTEGRQDMSISIDNVGGEMWRALELAQMQPQFPITVTWRAYTTKQTAAPQAVPVVLSTANVAITDDAVSLAAERTDLINRRWPTKVYRPDRWPGLVR